MAFHNYSRSLYNYHILKEKAWKIGVPVMINHNLQKVL